MSYPATLDVQTPESIARWRPLVQWILAIPHFIVVYVLGAVSNVVSIISWFVILFTGKLPEGLADVQMMILRYNLRVFAYDGFLHESYPPFDFTATADEPGGTPVSVGFAPALEDRNRLTVGLRFIWIIPAAFVMFFIWIAASVVWFIAFFAVIITGVWPDGMRSFVVRALRMGVQVGAYGALLTDEYPPLTLDTDDVGGVTPPPAPAAQ